MLPTKGQTRFKDINKSNQIVENVISIEVVYDG